MNKVFLTGNLTRSPEMKLTPDGTAKVASFGLGVNERYTDRETGEQRETVCFLACEAWNVTAENIFRFFKKGSPILIEGRLRFDAWQADDGTNRSRVKIRVNRFEFMTQRNGTPDSESESETAAPAPSDPQTSADENPPF